MIRLLALILALSAIISPIAMANMQLSQASTTSHCPAHQNPAQAGFEGVVCCCDVLNISPIFISTETLFYSLEAPALEISFNSRYQNPILKTKIRPPIA